MELTGVERKDMSTSAIRISLAAAVLVGTAFFAATTASKAQAVDPNQLRAAQETEEEFSDQQRAMQADEEDNDPANAQRLMVLDSSGRPYMYDGIRDGITCRARRVPVRRMYRRTVRCGFGGQQQGAFIQQQQGGVFPQQQFDPGQFRAAEEREESFTDEQRAIQADEEDNDPANAQRMIIVDASGRPIQYEPSRGYSCRTVRIPTRAVYRRTIACGR
jgi:guanyl-specific ribonuclease Sa